MTKLLPCPFCGVQPDQHGLSIQCVNPECKTICGTPTRENSAEIWNTRLGVQRFEVQSDAPLDRRAIQEAMQDAWNTICSDTGCHPNDIKREGKKLFFEPGHWADLVALYLDATDDLARHGCDWPTGYFTFCDESGEHDPCYVVMPGGAMLALNHHAGEGVDVARAKFIVAACNAALACRSAPAAQAVLTPSGCDWPDKPFTFRDEPAEHDPCYVVMPDGAMLPLNHHADPGVDIARAKFIVDACNTALSPDFPHTAVAEAMQDAWNTICTDTGCHPLDIERRGKELFFKPGHWADLVALFLSRGPSAPSAENATPPGTGGPGSVAADQPAANAPATSISSADRT